MRNDSTNDKHYFRRIFCIPRGICINEHKFARVLRIEAIIRSELRMECAGSLRAGFCRTENAISEWWITVSHNRLIYRTKYRLIVQPRDLPWNYFTTKTRFIRRTKKNLSKHDTNFRITIQWLERREKRTEMSVLMQFFTVHLYPGLFLKIRCTHV